MSGSSEPFAVLGLEPTLDMARVKRAYFEAVARTPPYRDAVAFARVRGAYEALTKPGGLEAAYLSAPLDARHGLGALQERYAPALAEARERLVARRQEEERLPAFIEAVSTSSLAACLAAFARRS